MDLFQKIKGIVEGVVKAVSQRDFDAAVHDVTHGYLEKRFKVELFPVSAGDGSIEFHTRDGRLFATLNPQEGIRVETGGAVYFFSVDEILKVQGKKNHKEYSCEPEGREVVIDDDGIFKGVHDYDRQQSIPADEAIYFFSEDELRLFIEDEALALQNAAKRHAEEAPPASSKKKAAPARTRASEEPRRPREATQIPRDEPARREDDLARVDALHASEARLPENRPPETAPIQQVPTAVLPPAQAAKPGLPVESNFACVAPNKFLAQSFTVSSEASEDPPARSENGKSVESKRANESPRVVDEGFAIPAEIRAQIADDSAAVAVSVKPHLRVARIESENARGEFAVPSNSDAISCTRGGVSMPKPGMQDSSRASDHASISAEFCVMGNPRFDGVDSRIGVLGTVMLIEYDPLAIAGAQADKGGLTPISSLISMIKGGHTESETRLRPNVEAAHAKRDSRDQQGGGGRGRDDSPDGWDPFYEDEESLFT